MLFQLNTDSFVKRRLNSTCKLNLRWSYLYDSLNWTLSVLPLHLTIFIQFQGILMSVCLSFYFQFKKKVKRPVFYLKNKTKKKLKKNEFKIKWIYLNFYEWITAKWHKFLIQRLRIKCLHTLRWKIKIRNNNQNQ